MRYILPTIVIAQFFCTSLWFAGNSIIADLGKELELDQGFLAHLTSSIQLGFIAGTLVFAVFTIADRFSPSLVFFLSAIFAGLFNLGITLDGIGPAEILAFRFLTGFFLAGIYPVGMKIASDYYQAGLGKSLGFLVGALVMGTAFPHLLKYLTLGLPWKFVMYGTSVLSLIGGMGIWFFVPDGPFHKSGQGIKLTAFMRGFRNRDFRAFAFGYFGHMWELYAFWAFVPVMLSTYNRSYPELGLNVPLYAFLIIASGAFACILGGVLSQYFGAKKIARLSLLISCICCLVSPIFLLSSSPVLFLTFLFVWGLSVIADSPLFSTLVATHAPAESRGSSLTIVNCIGFSITIVSIQAINLLSSRMGFQYLYLLLAIGPLLGLLALSRSGEASRGRSIANQWSSGPLGDNLGK
ncbi:MFS transporter [Algoriphagus aestuariicola]|uniref:MFS transporter n=1 Tax=Algoriphagus aestuariicola TaxID=1852016 RepID=A0ABS3BLV3_9BACT|nr:MFS transporter [Algoriphagus aestuariicola]MBN7800045.1 MFS transporter [Algoriphagus aestuariicola]